MNDTRKELPKLTPEQKAAEAVKCIRGFRERNRKLAAEQREIIAELADKQNMMNEFDCGGAFSHLPVSERLSLRQAIFEMKRTVDKMNDGIEQLEHSDIHVAAIHSVFPPEQETQ